MGGWVPGDPSVALSMPEFATVKSALPSVVTHSDALESYSLFCTMYVPPPTDAVCSWHSVVVAACAPVLPTTEASAPPSVSTSAVTVARTAFLCLIRPPLWLHGWRQRRLRPGTRIEA